MCCGIVFKGAGNELAIDMTNFKPCRNHYSTQKRQKSVDSTTDVISSVLPSAKDKVFSDNSSDSGYDEYSNQEKNKENSNDETTITANNTITSGTTKVLNIDKVLMNGTTMKPSFVLNGATVKVNAGNLVKQNNIVVIKPKKQVVALGNTFIVKSPSPITQVQQAAN